MKTLSVVWMKIARNIVGVIIARVAQASDIALPVPDIYFHPGGSLHGNGVRLQSRGLADFPDKTIVGGAPCVSGGLRFWDG